jgi:hypothetical protein
MMMVVGAASLELQAALHKIKLLKRPHMTEHAQIAVNGIEADAWIFVPHLVINILGRQESVCIRKYLRKGSTLVGDSPTVPGHYFEHFLHDVGIRHRFPSPLLFYVIYCPRKREKSRAGIITGHR